MELNEQALAKVRQVMRSNANAHQVVETYLSEAGFTEEDEEKKSGRGATAKSEKTGRHRLVGPWEGS